MIREWNCFIKNLLIFLVLLFFCIGCANPETKKTRHYEKGMEYLHNNDPKSAIIEFRNALKIDPKFADANYQAGLGYLQLQSPHFAFKYLEMAIKLDPSNLDALLKTAEMFFLGNLKEESRERLQKVLTLDPQHVDALILAANLELSENNFGEARKYLEMALTVRPDLDRIYRVMAKLHLAERRFEDLEGTLKKAVAVGPQDSANYTALVSYYLSIIDLEQAEAELLNMASMFPGEVQPHLDLAKLYLRQGKKDKGEAAIANAIKMRPEDPGLYVRLGDFFQDEGRADEAETAYKHALSISKKPMETQAILADFYLTQGKTDLAKQEVASILQQDREHEGGLLVQAKIMLFEKKYNDALKVLDDLLIKDPGNGEVFYQKALVYLGLDDLVLSEKALARAVLYTPENAMAHTLFAKFLMKKENFEEAGREALFALQIKPDNLRAGIIYSECLLRQKKVDMAASVLKRMLFWFPNNPEVAHQQGLVLVARNQLPEALTHFQKIIDTEPGYIPSLILLIEISDRLQKKEMVIDILRQQDMLLPNNPDIMMLLGNHLLQRKKYEEALQVFQRLQAIIPEDPNPYIMAATIQKKTGAVQDGIEKYRTAIQGKEISPSILLNMGALLELRGDVYGAKEAYRKALEINPDFAIAANNLAWLILQEKYPDLDEALNLAVHARKIDTDNASISDTLGMVHLRRGFHHLAEIQFRRSADAVPNNPLYLYHLAMALSEQGEFEEARKELKQCLELGVDFPERLNAEKLLKKINQHLSAEKNKK